MTEKLKHRIGVVATNQARKEWGLVAAIARSLINMRDDITFWWHTDQLIRDWSIPALLSDYELDPTYTNCPDCEGWHLGGKPVVECATCGGGHIIKHTLVEITLPPITDAELATRYRSCALTIAPGLGEGFGYPIFESLACGVPVLHGDYAGGASIMRTCGLDAWLVQPVTFRLEGQFNCLRPVYSPEAWVTLIEQQLEYSSMEAEHTERAVEHLNWQAIGPRWRRWFRDGVGC